MIKQTMTRHWQEEWSALSDTPVLQSLDRISAPVLIVTGSEDASDIHSIADTYMSLLPHAQHVKIDGAGHLLTWEKHAKFNQILSEFLLCQSSN